jgi:anti-sigma-K factor RskA
MSVDEPRIGPEPCGANAAPYVLGALTEAEHENFRRHLESCAVCREEVAALQVAADALPAAAPQVPAPRQLRDRVMSDVREDARRRQAGTSAATSTQVRAGSRAARSRLRWRPNLAVAVLAAVVVALAVIAIVPGGEPGTRTIRAQVRVSGARASLSVSGESGQLRIAGMPQAGPGRVYEVWRQGSGAPQPTDALFTVSSAGDATVGVPGGVARVRQVLVTSEPLGGSRVPTRTPLIIAHL